MMLWLDEYRSFLAASAGDQAQQVGRLAERIAFAEQLAAPLTSPRVDGLRSGQPTEIKAKIVRAGVSLAGRFVDISELNLANAGLYLIFLFEPHKRAISVFEIRAQEMHRRLTAAHSVTLGFLKEMTPVWSFSD
ncbi:hypothetical protein Sa4125_38920 [Aureimonas sp. SA4125]|uniref:hypothetical protein n=1 Tax=Aureimonas sp. SA4125 TaxID=2826993 RepID=UPI001CC48F66|nr:hypothetical protein [Aureimonas sp. SA4125]BDA86350.1 hypothetical protein Sa4125_38920 [Aureimonas sp. SA4125]